MRLADLASSAAVSSSPSRQTHKARHEMSTGERKTPEGGEEQEQEQQHEQQQEQQQEQDCCGPLPLMPPHSTCQTASPYTPCCFACASAAGLNMKLSPKRAAPTPAAPGPNRGPFAIARAPACRAVNTASCVLLGVVVAVAVVDDWGCTRTAQCDDDDDAVAADADKDEEEGVVEPSALRVRTPTSGERVMAFGALPSPVPPPDTASEDGGDDGCDGGGSTASPRMCSKFHTAHVRAHCLHRSVCTTLWNGTGTGRSKSARVGVPVCVSVLRS